MFSEIWRRVGMLIGREKFARELDEEMKLHREMKERELVARGAGAEQARYAAARAFGNATELSERGREAWGWRWLEDFGQDLRFGARMLRKNLGFTLTAVLTLALGVGANTAVFSIVNAWLVRPLPLKNPQELVSVWRTREEAPRQPAYFNLYHDYLVWASRNKTLESLAATFEQRYALTGAGEPEQIHGAVASWNLFQTVGGAAEVGRLFVADDAQGEPACVISHGLWERKFQSAQNILGQTIQLNRKLYRVLGVLPASFSLRVLDRPFETEVWTVITPADKDYDTTSPTPVAALGRLRNDTTASQAEAELSALQMQLNHDFSDEPKNSGVLVVNLQRDNTRTIRSSLLLLFGAVGVLLLISCVNTGSLILGRNSHRLREFAVRVALGCSTRRLLQQLSAEVLTIFAWGGIAGVAIAFCLLRIFIAWSPFGVLPPGGVSLDVSVLAGTAIVVFGAALLFGSLPALRAVRLRDDIFRASQVRATSGRQEVRGRSLFVAMEIALSVVLLLAAGLLLSTFLKIDSEPVGFHLQDVLVGDVTLPHATYATNQEQTRFCEKLLARLKGTTGVRATGAAVTWPFNVDGLTPLETEKEQGQPMEQLPHAATFQVSPGYFDALGISLLHGRDFDSHDRPNSPSVAIINDEMARQYFSGDPLGKRIRLRYIDQPTPKEPWMTIVGVAGSTRSIRYNQIQWDKYPAVYTSLYQQPDGPRSEIDARTQTVFLYVQAEPTLSGGAIAAALHGIDPKLPFDDLRTTREIVSGLRSQPRVRAVLLGIFGGLTLLLAGIGVGGVTGQMVQQRRRDIGIRMALGARRADVQRIVLGHAFKLAGWGIAAGVLAGAGVSRLLRSFLFGISAFDPATFGGVIVLLAGVALVAAYLPARRAAKLDPMVVLRNE
jgi:putative ABC transport system permease protein